MWDIEADLVQSWRHLVGVRFRATLGNMTVWCGISLGMSSRIVIVDIGDVSEA